MRYLDRMWQRSTLQLLRFHFSLFLLPVFLFALSQVSRPYTGKALLLFFIWHLLVYPASNGYNSYMDRDVSPIGGLKKPLQPSRELFYVTVLMNALAIVLAISVSVSFAAWVTVYILASQAYSWRGIRLKKYPVIGFLTVFIFQGAVVYLATYNALEGKLPSYLPPLIASLLIGALYPLTQIYQHEADRADGVTTISYLAGKRGSFILSGVLFGAATAALFFFLRGQNKEEQFYIFLLCTAPVVLFFVYWMVAVWRNEKKASFQNSLAMNLVATLCTTVYFSIILILNH